MPEVSTISDQAGIYSPSVSAHSCDRRRRRLVWVLPLVCLAAAAAETKSWQLSELPAWVQPLPELEPPAERESPSTAGWRGLVLDYQTDVEREISFRRWHHLLENESGVQNGSTLRLAFSPAYQSLQIHYIRVRRGDQIVDQTTTVQPQIIQREQSLERFMYDGRATAVILLDDTRPGDCIEYAYSIVGRNPVFNGRFMQDFSLATGDQLQYLRVLVKTPESRPLQCRAVSSARIPARLQEHGCITYLWAVKNVAAIQYESQTPDWYDQYPYIEFSEFADWAAVVEWALRLYRSRDSGTALRSRVSEIEAAAPTDIGRAQHAVRIVQDEIRYLSLLMGEHSHAPTAPEIVLQRRFGDCKDKSLLLTTLLRELGLRADPALVHSRYAGEIGRLLPSPAAFDHVIVRLQLPNQTLWIDPTRSRQGGALSDFPTPTFGKALVIAEDCHDLVEIEPAERRFGVDIHELYRAPTFRDPAELTVTSVYYGNNADAMRVDLSETERQDLQRDYLNYYAGLYDDIEVAGDLVVDDDLEANQIRIIERYRLPEFWYVSVSDRERGASIYAKTLSDYLLEPDERVRTTPLALAYPRRVRYTSDIYLPRPFVLADHDLALSSPVHSYAYQRQTDAAHIHLEAEYRTLKDHVAITELAAYLGQVDTIKDSLSLDLSEHYVVAAADRAAAVPMVANREGIMLLLFSLVLFLIGVRPAWRPRHQAAAAPDSGIRGPLAALAWGVMLVPLFLIRSCFDPLARLLIIPQDAGRHVCSLVELLAGAALFVSLLASVTAVPLFLQRRREYVPVQILVLVGAALGGVLLRSGPAAGVDSPLAATTPLALTATAGLVVSLYLLLAARVRRTFVQ